MSLDGLRAWIGEVERKLAARTRVFLVLLAIAIGAAGAAIYLALEADDGGGGGGSSVSAAEVQSLQEQISTLSAGGGENAALESQIIELRTKVEDLEAEQGGGGKGSNGGGTDGSGDDDPGGIEGIPGLPQPETDGK